MADTKYLILPDGHIHNTVGGEDGVVDNVAGTFKMGSYVRNCPSPSHAVKYRAAVGNALIAAGMAQQFAPFCLFSVEPASFSLALGSGDSFVLHGTGFSALTGGAIYVEDDITGSSFGNSTSYSYTIVDDETLECVWASDGDGSTVNQGSIQIAIMYVPAGGPPPLGNILVGQYDSVNLKALF